MRTIDLSVSGLGEKEAIAYLALLELGEASMSMLVKKARLKRSTLYFVINELTARGLVSTVKRKKKTLYIAESPTKLLDRADDNRKTLERILPELLSITNTLRKKPKVRYFEGIEGMKEVYRDMLKYPEQKMYAWVAGGMIEHFDTDFIEKYYIPKRIEKKIWAEVIASDTAAGRAFQSKDIPGLRKTRLLEEKEFPLSIEVNVYGTDAVGFVSLEDKLGLIIESKPIADTLRSIFKAQWMALEETN